MKMKRLDPVTLIDLFLGLCVVVLTILSIWQHPIFVLPAWIALFLCAFAHSYPMNPVTVALLIFTGMMILAAIFGVLTGMRLDGLI